MSVASRAAASRLRRGSSSSPLARSRIRACCYCRTTSRRMGSAMRMTSSAGTSWSIRTASARSSPPAVLPPALQEREELLNYSGNIHPIYFGHETEGWVAFRKLVLSVERSRSTDPFIRFPPYGRKGLTVRQTFDLLRQFDRVTIAAFLQLFQPGRFIEGYVLESKPEQAPNPESRR